MSDIELIPIQNRGAPRRETPPVISDTKHRPYSPSSKDQVYEDLDEIKQTPSSSVPLLSSLKTGQGDRRSVLTAVWQWALVLLVPAITIAYLAFCYVVHYRVVPANISVLSASTMTQLLTNVASVVTTINIIIISLALFPLKGLLYELKSEEFFRLLSTRRNSRGVELNAVNGISNSSYGVMASITAVLHWNCSLYYVMVFVAAICVWAVSTLAPAALSIQSVLIDGAIMAFTVGAIPRQNSLSLYQPVVSGQVMLPNLFSPAPAYSTTIAWAERMIGLSYSFSVLNDSQGEYAGFVVPTPNSLNSTVSARYLTDVIGVNPYCTWANPINLTATSLNSTMNSSQVLDVPLKVHLEGVDLQVSVRKTFFPVNGSYFVSSINVYDPTAYVFNYTTGSIPTDGAMVMSVIQCASSNCTSANIDIVSVFVNFTNIPTLTFSTVGADYEIGFLVCKPNITIETREVRTSGSMTLQVQPLADGASPYPRQGNLDWTQASLLFSYSLSSLSTDSGPHAYEFQLDGLGSQTQVDFLFGSGQRESIPSGAVFVNENTTMTVAPLSTDQLAAGYTELVKASMKPYVSGSLGYAYVPGRVASVQQIFVSSMPHVIASTVLLFLLFTMACVAYCRRGKGEQFNLTNVAVALADSELPEMAKKAKMDLMAGTKPARDGGKWLGSSVGQELAERLGNWKVSLRPPATGKSGGVETLHIERE